MTDTNPIAELSPCRRREIMTNRNGVTVFCKPPARPRGIPAAELIKDSKWFRKRRIAYDQCQGCLEGEDPDPTLRESSLKTTIRDPRTEGGAVVPEESDTDTRPNILDNGTIVYARVGWEPPPVPPGYQRKSHDLTSDDAWVLVRKEPLCQHCSLLRIRRENCNCLRIVPTCTYQGKSENLRSGQSRLRPPV